MSDDTPPPKDPLPLLERPLTITTGLLMLVGAAVSGGFWAGLHYSESKALADKSELVAQHAQAVTDLKICGTNLSTEKSSVAAVQATCTHTQAALAEKDRQILELTSALERQSNCAFIQAQIRETQAAIERPTIRSITDTTAEAWVAREREAIAKRTVLEQRLAEYQKQLGTCHRP